MAYWIFRNGETVGPLRAIEVLEEAGLETLVSHDQSWLKLSEHPDFVVTPSPEEYASANSAAESENSIQSLGNDGNQFREDSVQAETRPSNYWIYQNSETIGPFNKRKVISLACASTLVSQGQEWLPFEVHPDFQKEGRPEQLNSGPACQKANDKNATLETRGAKRDSETHSRNPCDQSVTSRDLEKGARWTDSARGTPRTSKWNVLALRLLSYAGALAFLSLLIMGSGARLNYKTEPGEADTMSSGPSDFSTVSLEPTDEPSANFLPQSQTEKTIDKTDGFVTDGRWVFSKPFNLISMESDLKMFETEQHVLFSTRKTLTGYIERGYFTRREGHIAWANPQFWREQDRTTQAFLLEMIAELESESYDPGDWTAEIRDSSTDEILAVTSENGLRCLWTADGFAPETPPSRVAVDIQSPMTAEERVEFLEVSIGHLGNRISGLAEMEGKMVLPALADGGTIYIFDAVLTPLGPQSHDTRALGRKKIAVFFPFDHDRRPDLRGAFFRTHVKKEDFNSSVAGTTFPGYVNKPDTSKNMRSVAEYERLTSELNKYAKTSGKSRYAGPASAQSDGQRHQIGGGRSNWPLFKTFSEIPEEPTSANPDLPSLESLCMFRSGFGGKAGFPAIDTIYDSHVEGACLVPGGLVRSVDTNTLLLLTDINHSNMSAQTYSTEFSKLLVSGTNNLVGFSRQNTDWVNSNLVVADRDMWLEGCFRISTAEQQCSTRAGYPVRSPGAPFNSPLLRWDPTVPLGYYAQ